MILPYFVRLACLCFATFLAVQLAVGPVAWCAARYADVIARKYRPRTAARILFLMRLGPTAAAALAVLLLCVPSYLWLEPAATNERVGLLFCSAGVIGACLCAHSLFRATRAMMQTMLYAHKCVGTARELFVPEVQAPALILEDETSTLAMTGLLWPRLLISRRVLEVLSNEQLEVALSHERAHCKSRDNFKRFLFLLAPELAPFAMSFRKIERAWRRVSEWAADDAAAQGDPMRSVALAGALVRVARISAVPKLSPICTMLVPGRADLVERVERLLNPRKQSGNALGRFPTKRLALGAGALCSVACTLALLRPVALLAVHNALERLIH
jgi:beta-lactamase regulating signal transducer with metallopeptidase domain